jgi:zinc transport system substrate-binding protein
MDLRRLVLLLAAVTSSAIFASVTIVATFHPVYVNVLNITDGIKDIDVVRISNPGVGCLHDYQLNTSEMKTISKARVLVANGAGMESFLSRVAGNIPSIKIIEASKGIELLYDEKSKTYNSHVWLSIEKNIEQLRNIERELSALFPEYRAAFKKNTDTYVARLVALNSKMHSELAFAKGKKIITFHEAFPYFAKEFNLELAAVIEREPGQNPSARELADTIKIIRTKKIHALFTEPQYPVKSAQIIAQETGLKIYELDPVVTGKIDGKNDYLDAMERNLKVLKEALAND